VMTAIGTNAQGPWEKRINGRPTIYRLRVGNPQCARVTHWRHVARMRTVPATAIPSARIGPMGRRHCLSTGGSMRGRWRRRRLWRRRMGRWSDENGRLKSATISLLPN
jgi:hypothetical protein